MKPSPEAVLDDLEGLRALARSLVHGDTEADDLIQDTAIAAITHPPDGDRPARPWLATVLRNRWRMNRRTDSRRRAREHAVAPDDTTDGESHEAAAERIDRARVLERLAAALVALDEPFRTTVIRRYLDGESAAEIARAQGVPPGTVRWRLKTGLDRLRADLDRSQPRWKRALVPFVAVKGAAVVKAKTSVAILIAFIALLGTVFFVIVKARGNDTAPAPTVTGSNRTAEVGAKPDPAAVRTQAGSASVPRPVDPLPGQGRATIALRSAPGGAIAGRVINWSTGGGVANAELTFTGEGGAQTVRSNEHGGFELAPPAPGRFVLAAVVAPGFLPYAPELLHSSVQVELAKDRAVEGITVFLFPAIDYRGKVVDATGAPVPGATVRLLGTPTGEQTIEKLETEWTTGKDGTFVFHAADDAVFEATRGTKRGWARLDGDVAITKQLVIQLGDAAARDAKITGKVVDLDGVPLPDVLVRAQPEGGPPPSRDAMRDVEVAPRATAFATTGADGSFVLEDLDRELYTIGAESPDHATLWKTGVAGGSKAVTLVMDPGFALGGRVVTASDEPVPAYTLLVMRRMGVVRELVTARSIVEPDGKFRVRVVSGEYELVASASGLAPSAPTVVGAGEQNAKIVVSEGATLTGKVIDATSGAPLAYARIMREAAGGGASTTPANAGTVTREDGTFELTGIPPGPLSVSVGAGDYHPKIEAGMTAIDGATLGPLIIPLTKLAAGEKPTLELVGIGVKLRAEHESAVVELVMPESGAQAAGIVAGDRIVAVDGVGLDKLGLDGAVARIRGVVGTRVSVTLRRGDQDVELVVERKKLKA